MKNKKILFFTYERKLGGGSKSIVTLMKELQQKGYEIHAIVPFGFGPVFEEIKKMGIPYKVVFFGWWQMPAYWNKPMKFAFRALYQSEVFAVKRIVRYVKNNQIDIIHSASSVIDVGAKVAQKCNIPHVWHVREFGKDDYQLEYIKGREKSIQYMNETAAKVVFISKDLREYYADVDSRIATVIYNGISEDFLQEKKFEEKTPQKKVIFLISGNLARNKGQMLALQAAKRLKNQGETDFLIWIAGQANATSDSVKYEQELKQYVENHLEGYVEFLGYRKDMKKVRFESDVELVCSNREAFGRVTIEAMMSSNPVIASNSGANGELVQNEENGLLFENKDAVSLSEQMLRVIHDQKLRNKMGQNAFLYAKTYFLSEKNTENIERMYCELPTA